MDFCPTTLIVEGAQGFPIRIEMDIVLIDRCGAVLIKRRTIVPVRPRRLAMERLLNGRKAVMGGSGNANHPPA